VKITDRIPLVIPPNEHNRFYLQTKSRKSGHLLDGDGHERLMEQLDRPVLEGMSSDEAARVQEQ